MSFIRPIDYAHVLDGPSRRGVRSRGRGVRSSLRGAVPLVAALLLGGCATTGTEPHDPYEEWNRDVFAFNNALDDAVLKPLSVGYDTVTPNLVQDWVYNFFSNLAYPGTILNDVLQGKFATAARDTGRFVFNSTLGLGGILDIAAPMGLPPREEDFGQTLAVWGVGEGEYLELPFFGPSTMRDLPGLVLSFFTDVQGYYPSPERFVMSGVEIMDTRARLDPLIDARDEQLDPYVFQREGYRQRRQSLIFDGNPPAEQYDFDEPLD